MLVLFSLSIMYDDISGKRSIAEVPIIKSGNMGYVVYREGEKRHLRDRLVVLLLDQIKLLPVNRGDI